MRRLAAEIPDIFDSDVFPAGDSFTGSGVVMRRRTVSGETARGGFGLEDSFTPSPVVKTSLLQTPSEQTATTPKLAGRDSDYIAADRGAAVWKFFPISAQGL